MTTSVLKEGIIVGRDGRAENKVGPPPGYVKTYPANGVSQQAFYRFCEAVIMTTDTFENLQRVGFEAMARAAFWWSMIAAAGASRWSRVSRVDVLIVDVEGLAPQVLDSYPVTLEYPAVVPVEYVNLCDADRERVISFGNGCYRVIDAFPDYLFIQRAPRLRHRRTR